MTPEALIAAMEATWPPAATHRVGPVMLRTGLGGGKRVSAASVNADWTTTDLETAERAMRATGQPPLFQVLPHQGALDAALAGRGYALVDPVLGYAAPVSALARPLPPLTAFAHWPPLEIARSIWAEAGIGPMRVAVMERVTGQRAVVLVRQADRPAGVAFVALSGDIAMVHALEVRASHRRQGVAGQILQAAASWAEDQSARELSLVVTKANAPARALYQKLGMQALPGYHYRELKT